jgi:hypothetical protein
MEQKGQEKRAIAESKEEKDGKGKKQPNEEITLDDRYVEEREKRMHLCGINVWKKKEGKDAISSDYCFFLLLVSQAIYIITLFHRKIGTKLGNFVCMLFEEIMGKGSKE